MILTARVDGGARVGARTAGALLVLATLLVYAPSFHHPFVNYDDPAYVVDNPHVRSGLSGEGIAWALRAVWPSYWHPLAWLSHMADVEIFGLSPGAHHAVSVLIHAFNGVLLMLVLLRGTRALGRSLFVAALFALHPLHVESVAWIAERKDVLCGLFFLLTLLAYLRYAKRPGRVRYGCVVVLMALGLWPSPCS